MREINYNLLNKKLDEFIYDDYYVFENDFLFEERLCDIILKNKFPIDIESKSVEELYFCKNKISCQNSIKICSQFFKNINDSYQKKLLELIDDNIIKFEFPNSIDEKSYIDISANKIHVMSLKSIEDVLSLGHEYMHYRNHRRETVTNVTSYYTESFSNFIEFLLVDYVKNNYPKYKKDILKMKRNIFTALYQNNIITKIIIELMKKKINGRIINRYEVFDIIDKMHNYGLSLGLISTAFTEFLKDLSNDEDFFENAYFVSVENTIALPLSCYMYNLSFVKNKKEEILTLSDHLNKFDIMQVLTYLDLHFESDSFFNLTEESYTKLEKSYQKNLKKLW